MEPIVSTIDIARPPEDVFRYVTDPTRFAKWQHDVVAVHSAGPDALGVGSRFTTVRRIGDVERTLVQEIIQFVPPMTWAASRRLAVSIADAGRRSRTALNFADSQTLRPSPRPRQRTRPGPPKAGAPPGRRYTRNQHG
jgi:polyketide cyclase/dehydrase/lipid transport protein